MLLPQCLKNVLPGCPSFSHLFLVLLFVCLETPCLPLEKTIEIFIETTVISDIGIKRAHKHTHTYTYNNIQRIYIFRVLSYLRAFYIKSVN